MTDKKEMIKKIEVMIQELRQTQRDIDKKVNELQVLIIALRYAE